jgi:hypothetical protein
MNVPYDISDEVSDKSLGLWTRQKNDKYTFDFDSSKNTELYKFMTFSPEYLSQRSCVSGNTQNCRTYSNMDLEKENRIGVLTNLNEIQRDTTNDKSMGVLTTPDFRSGNLIDPRLIQDMSILESKLQHTTRLDIPSSSVMNQHHLNEDVQNRNYPEQIPRSELHVSSRVSRRNSFAQKCKYN